MPEKEVDRLRRLATEALKTAAEMNDDDCRQVMIEVAAAYVRLAQYVEQRVAPQSFPDGPD